MCGRCSLRGTLEDSSWNKTSACKKRREKKKGKGKEGKERKEKKKRNQKPHKRM